jgi:uncharacterized protein YgfB (UPF0149 family)
MTTLTATSYAQLDQLLASLHLGVDASDLHGSLAGYLCGGGKAGAHDWLHALELETDTVADAPHRALAHLYEECAAWFAAPDASFELLLPGADSALATRGAALVEWCRGFLGGLGLSGVSPQHGWSPEVNEILQDFTAIAAAQFEYADAEEDETALAEVIEFVRAGVLLLHAELTAAPTAATLH